VDPGFPLIVIIVIIMRYTNRRFTNYLLTYLLTYICINSISFSSVASSFV